MFVKIKKKMVGVGSGWGRVGGRVWGVRVDVNEELKFLRKFAKKHSGGGVRWRVGGRLVGGQGGCERNVGGRGDVGYEGCEPRIEGILQCTKRYCTILRKLKKCGGGGGAIFEPKTLSMYLKKTKKKN